MIKLIQPTGIINISDKLILKLMYNMGVDKKANIRKCDIAKIKVVGRRAMRKFIKEKYLSHRK